MLNQYEPSDFSTVTSSTALNFSLQYNLQHRVFFTPHYVAEVRQFPRFNSFYELQAFVLCDALSFEILSLHGSFSILP